MNSSLNVAVEPPARPSPAAPHLTSWYAQGRSDALGDRLLMFDNATAGSFELLRFRSALTKAAGFEQALRNRVSRLEAFRHPAFTTVLSVEHLEGGEGLTMVSAHVAGKRLSEMFQAPRLVGLHPTFATWLIHQLTPALADLQRQGGDIAHGALSADRIVLTPDGSFVMVEHVFAAALERLHLSPTRLWNEFGIASPPTGTGVARLDCRTDVIQLALIVLSILLGRRVTASEYPNGLRALLDECCGAIGQRSHSMLPLRRWLERALGIAGQPFRSADEARLGLTELPGYGAPAAIGGPGGPLAASGAARATEETSMKGPAVRLVGARTGADGPSARDNGTGSFSNESVGAPASRPVVQPSSQVGPTGGQRVDQSASQPVGPSARQRGAHSLGQPINAAAGRTEKLVSAIAIGVGVVALAEAAAIAYLVATRAVVVPSARVPVTIESPEGGDTVLVDGRQAGTTPLAVNVGADVHSIRIVNRIQQPTLPVLASQEVTDKRPDAPAADAKATAALAAAAARQRSGGIRFSSPIELKVLEGERVLGSTADGPIVTTAGAHELDLINTTYGYRSRQNIVVKAGQMVSLSIAPPNGRVSINASPWAQVWIDGRALGETPIANVSAAVGEHDITFRHPQLGEKRETVVVRSDALTRVSASFGR